MVTRRKKRKTGIDVINDDKENDRWLRHERWHGKRKMRAIEREGEEGKGERRR